MLGIVTDATTRFYPMESVDERGAVIDELDDRRILVYVDPTTFTPAALFVDARSATLEDREVQLDTGGVVRDGLLYEADGTRADADRPQQFFSRWYGFRPDLPRAGDLRTVDRDQVADGAVRRMRTRKAS